MIGTFHRLGLDLSFCKDLVNSVAMVTVSLPGMARTTDYSRDMSRSYKGRSFQLLQLN